MLAPSTRHSLEHIVSVFLVVASTLSYLDTFLERAVRKMRFAEFWTF